MRLFAILTLFFVLFSMLAGAFIQRHLLTCELLPFLNYPQIDDRVFLGSAYHTLSKQEQKTILDLIDSASNRIYGVYGKHQSKPYFFLTTDNQEAADWRANQTATMHRLPWRSCIVIGPKGHNTDVIAHEWLHAEIQHRIGLFRFIKEIPVWFDEGAALTLDYRAPYLPENIDVGDAEILAVTQLKDGNSFYSKNLIQHYQAARLAVEPLIQSEQFFKDLDRIGSGESFNHVFFNNKNLGLEDENID